MNLNLVLDYGWESPPFTGLDPEINLSYEFLFSPSSVEEIQAVLKIANEHCVQLWVCSQGKNFGYGRIDRGSLGFGSVVCFAYHIADTAGQLPGLLVQ